MKTRAAMMKTTAILFLGAALAATPVAIDWTHLSVGSADALAQGKGGGNGGGNSGGNGGGNSGGDHGNSSGGKGNSGGNDRGKSGENRGSASSLGRLNAAHASATAMENASSRSVVGQLGAYKDAVADDDMEKAAEFLATAANHTVTEETVRAVNEKLGIELDDVQVTKLAEMASHKQ